MIRSGSNVLLHCLPSPSAASPLLRTFSSSAPSFLTSTTSLSAPPTPPPTSSIPKQRSSTSSHLTADEEASKANEEVNTEPPKYLAKALGVREVPTTGKLSREERLKNMMDQDKRMAERKHLVKQVAKGYFNDYNELRHHGGKAWLAPKTLIREDLSLYFPDIEGTSLETKMKAHTTDLFPGKISLVAVSSFQSSEEHINSFVRPTIADLKDNANFQYVYLNCQENPLKGFLVTLFLANLRRTVPKFQHPTYLLSSQSLEYLREPMGMTNKHVGYVFLVDENKKIRWAGCGWATREEEEALRKCAWVLVERLRKEKEELEGGEKKVE